MRKYSLLFLLAVGLFFIPNKGQAATVAERFSGRIIIQTQTANGIWYLYPVNKQRYWIGTAEQATKVMKKLSLAVSPAVLDAIPTEGDGTTGSATLRARLAGRFIRQSTTTDYWYVSPRTRTKYRIAGDLIHDLKARRVYMGVLTIGAIPIAYGYDQPQTPVNGLLRVQQQVSTYRGRFTVDLATLDTTQTTLKIMTDTASTSDCTTGCRTLSLKTYTDRRSATFGIHGTYFCPADYASCAGQTGYYYYPVMNSFSRVMINSSRVKYTNEPLVTFDENNQPTYYHHAKDFLGSDLFAPVSLTGLRAAISNGPGLVEKGNIVVTAGQLDSKQLNTRSYRGVLGWKGSTVYFFIVRNATVLDSAAVARAMGLEYAINLDGGGSTAMVQNGRYILGPGRSIPNAILLTQ